MHAENMPAASMTVRPELVPSALRLFDEEAEHFGRDRDPSCQGLAVAFTAAADAVRAGGPVDLAADAYPTTDPGAFTMRDEITRSIQREFETSVAGRYGQPEDERWDYRYLSDLAALAADIEAAEVMALAQV
jgi:hypothetical protein